MKALWFRVLFICCENKKDDKVIDYHKKNCYIFHMFQKSP